MERAAIPAGHTPGEWEETPATCKEAGKRVQKCAVCNAELNTEVIPVDSTKHTPGEWKVTEEATCTKKGKEVQTCKICGEVLAEKEIDTNGAHTEGDWVVTEEATCGKAGKQVKKCKDCNAVLATQTIEATGEHSYVWGYDNNNHWRACSVCGQTEPGTETE